MPVSRCPNGSRAALTSSSEPASACGWQGGDTLAVDAVLIIGEHGAYPYNEFGQHLYPRYRFFKEVTRVFREDGRAVPVFNDKSVSSL